MAKTYSCLLVHVVFATRERAPLLRPELHRRLATYVGGVLSRMGGVLIASGGVADHVHLLMSLPPSASVARAVKDVKGASSRWINEERGDGAFAWQAGYGAFSVSRSRLETVRAYVQRQEQHHLRRTFEAEMADLERRHRLPAS